MKKFEKKHFTLVFIFSVFFAHCGIKTDSKIILCKEKRTLIYFDRIIDSLTINKIFNKKDVKYVKSFQNKKNTLTRLQQLKFNNYLAYYYAVNLDFNKSIKLCEKNIGLKIENKKEQKIALGYSYYLLANCLLNQGNYRLTIVYSQKAITFFKKYNTIDGLAKCRMLLSNVYFYLKSYKDAENEINEGLVLFKNNRNNNYYMLLLTKIKILRVYKEKEAFKEIIKTYHELKKINSNDKFFTIEINVFYIEFLINHNELDIAKQIITETKPLVEKQNTIRSSDLFNWILADFDFSTNSPLSNKAYFIKRIDKCKQENDYQTLGNIYYYLKYDAYLTKDVEKLYNYSAEYDLSLKRISSDETKAEILELKTKYETEKKEQLIALNELQIDKKNKTILILFSTSLALIFSGILLYHSFKNKKRKENEELKKHFTNKLLENTEEERKRIAKELHDGINHELLTLKNNGLFSKIELNNRIDSIIEDIRSISRNLHPVMFEKIGLEHSVKNLIERLKIKNDFFISCEINYFNSLKKSKEIQLFRVIQEALNNIIKYSNAYAAKVTILENTKFIFIEVKDNGIGFNVEEKLKSKKSFGIHSIIERVHSINGEIKIISSSKGTIITIKIKK